MTTTNETVTVIAEVTPDQYETLRSSGTECTIAVMTEFSDDGDPARTVIVRERNIPDVLKQFLRYVISYEEYEGYDGNGGILGVDVGPYREATINWPTEVKVRILNMLKPRGVGIYTPYGDLDLEYNSTEAEVKALLDDYPRLRGMFDTDPDEVITWFR